MREREPEDTPSDGPWRRLKPLLFKPLLLKPLLLKPLLFKPLLPLLAVSPALVAAAPLWSKTPLSYDHSTHIFKAWHFWTEMLGRGRLTGWSHFWSFGVPADELVPMGGEVWTCLFHALTLGQLPWTRTYALAFAAFLVFAAYAAYRFSRYFWGPAAGVLCAWLTTLDPGGQLEGGWNWAVYWGVWPVTLGMSFWLMALPHFDRVLGGNARQGPAIIGEATTTECRAPRDALWAGLWLAAALLTHQMTLVASALVLPLLVLEHNLRKPRPSLERLSRLVAAVALGVALAAFFLVPFFTRAEFTQDLGWLGDGLDVTWQKLRTLQTFQHVWPPVHALALLGTALALWRRAPGAVFFAGAAALLVLLSSGLLVRDLHLERVWPSLIKLEYNRLLLVAKLFWFPLAAYALSELLAVDQCMRAPLSTSRRVLRWFTVGAPLPVSRHVLRWLTVSALVATVLTGGWKPFYDSQIRRAYEGEAERKHWSGFEETARWLAEQRAADSSHYRVAFHMWRGDHLSTLAPVYGAGWMHKVGYTPAQIYKNIPMTDGSELLSALSVKYLVSVYPLDHPALSLRKQIGDYRIYDYRGYRAEPFTVTGPGHSTVLEFEPELIRIQLGETGPASKLKLHLAHYDRWRATIDGSPVPLSVATVHGAEDPVLMELLIKDGELRVEYTRLPADWLGLALSLAALPGFGAVWWLGRRTSLWRSAFQRLEPYKVWLGAGVALILLGGVGTLLPRLGTRAHLLPAASLFHRVGSDASLKLAGQPCTVTAPLTFQCGPSVVKADVVSGVWGLHGCVTAPGNGPLTLTVPMTLGTALTAKYDPRKGKSGTVSVRIGDQVLGTAPARPDYLRQQELLFDTQTWQGQTHTVTISVSGTPLHCLDVQAR